MQKNAENAVAHVQIAKRISCSKHAQTKSLTPFNNIEKGVRPEDGKIHEAQSAMKLGRKKA